MKNLIRTVLISFCIALFACSAEKGERWSKEKAQQWQENQPWIVGFNYIPSNAINYTAMWDKTSFSPDLIDKELALAEETGFNTVRVVLQYLVWEDDPAYFKKTFDRFLEISDSHDIRVMPTFFDDCVFGPHVDPQLGEQPEFREGWYAWGWSPSPGHSRVVDSTAHPMLENYVKDVMSAFKSDDRILLWDLYNEPTNGGLGDKSLPLVRKVFRWSREINPDQPVSIAAWGGHKKLDDLVVNESDVITFHSYSPKDEVAKRIDELKQYGRPIIATEWLNRPMGSTVEDILPLLYNENVGAVHWGLVNGKTQTHLPWGHRPKDLPYNAVWQHDLYTRQFEPYRESELKMFKTLIDKQMK